MILADWIDTLGKVAIPLGIVIGVLIAWKMGAIRRGYEKGKEFGEKRKDRRDEP